MILVTVISGVCIGLGLYLGSCFIRGFIRGLRRPAPNDLLTRTCRYCGACNSKTLDLTKGVEVCVWCGAEWRGCE